MAEKEWNQAIAQFSAGLELSGNDKNLLYCRAVAYLAKAKDCYTLAAAAAGRGDISTAEGQAKEADSHFEKARQDANRLIELDNAYTDAWYVRGCIEMYTGDWNTALDTFSTCITQQPTSPFAWQRRGEVYSYIGDTTNAMLDLKKAAELGYIDTKKSETSTSEEGDDQNEFNSVKVSKI